MPAVNDTKFQPAVFLLTGIPGQEDIHVWISIPFCLMYVISIIGNSVLLFIIKTDPTLHDPMYIFLSMLAVTDLGLSLSTLPTTLGIYWFQSREISHDACFAQLFFIHLLTLMESSVLLSMAFDRFVAICNPLRYASILTLPRIAKMGLVCLLRGVTLMLPLPILLKQHRYCKKSILSNSYCLHQEVMTMACSDFRVNIIYGLFLIVSSKGLDFLLIVLSYVMIFKSVMSTACHGKRLKALNTCVSHVCVVFLFYTPDIALAVIYRFIKNYSPILPIVLGNVYMLVPPVMNPIVYSVKIREIRVRIIRVFFK
ncbi:olfactory receptor 51G2-like [Emydura macquarii macquarii]|uniref:olfactory receptor 51G2-like n=1 Tax=Emydura macquarii macquarii TaxID=1129001 RepID=UPI00352AC467